MAQDGPSKILALENNAFLHEYLSEFFKIHDCQIQFSKDPASCLAQAHVQDFGLVYLDAANIGNDLELFLTSLKGTGKKFKVLLVNIQASQVEKFKKIGVDAVLAEPVHVEDIAKAVRELMTLKVKSGSAQDALKLLIVDDEEELCNFLAEQFDEDGFQTYRAYNGKGALDLATKYQCNLAIVDLKLPQIRGEELVELWKRSDSTIKEVILITGGIDESIMSLKRKGFTVFQKPIDMDNLTTLVLDLCKKHSLKAKKEAGK